MSHGMPGSLNSSHTGNSLLTDCKVGNYCPDAGFSPCSFHGNLLRSTTLEGLRLTEVVYGPNVKNAVHSHEHAYIGITLDGECTQVCRHDIRSSESWTVMYHPVGEVHSDQFHDCGAREFNIEIANKILQRLCERFYVPNGAVQMDRGKAGWLAARLYGEFRLMDDISWIAIEGLTMELMAEIVRHNLKPSSPRVLPWLGQVQDILHARYTERLTLCDLASAVGVHPVHLAREFHRRVGCTIGHQVRQLRIEHACRLLSKDNRSMADIALSVGFPDQSQFTKTFKNLVGVTPSKYRSLKLGANFQQDC